MYGDLTFGTAEYCNSLDHMNTNVLLRYKLLKQLEKAKKLKNMTSEDMKKHAKMLEEFERNHTFF